MTTQRISAQVRTAGEALVEALAARGITHVFGIPGVHTIELYRGLAGSPLVHILPKHEQGAGFMADGYARACGKPAACMVITGPGLTNTLTAMGQAYSDSVPMLVIAACLETGDHGRQRGRLHESRDQRLMAAQVSAFAATCWRPEDIPEYLDRAMAVFHSRRPRPVYLEIPMDVLRAPASGHWQPRTLSACPAARPQDLLQAASMLASASNPMIIAGGGARGAAKQIRSLAEHLGAPVFSTIAGKGIMPPDHPLWLDAVLHSQAGREFVSKADVALVIGSELAQNELLTSAPLSLQGEVIRIDIDHEQLCDEQPCTLPLLADARGAVAAILQGVQNMSAPRSSQSVHHEVARLRDHMTASASGLEAVYVKALNLISRSLSDEALVYTDMTTIAYTGNYMWPAPCKGRWVHPAGFGSLGYALPAALGAAVASGSRPVVAIVGDGGFQFTLPELSVLAEHQLPVLIILWNNQCFGQIHKGMVQHQVMPVGTVYSTPDFMALAAAYGIQASLPQSEAEAEAALRDGIASGRPALVELRPELFGAAGTTPTLLETEAAPQ